jgi:hypothetical protein
MNTDREQDAEDARVRSRADALTADEVAAGTDDAEAQAAAILEESDEREGDGVHPPGPALEHRRSEDTVDAPDLDEV